MSRRRGTRRWRFGVIAMLVVVVATELAFAAVIVGAHREVDRQRQRSDRALGALTHVDARLTARTRDLLARTRELAERVAERDGAYGALLTAQQDLDAARRGLRSAAADTFRNNGQIQALSACIDGAERAISSAKTGHPEAAVGALRSAQQACEEALTAAGGDGPVFPFDFSDPYVLRVGPRYFAYSTNADAGNIQVISSTDLRHWSLLGNALPRVPSWATPGTTWAPAVLAVGSHYVVYFTTRETASGDACIATAVAAAPQGPFVYPSAGPLVCQRDAGGSIDPSPYVDRPGHVFLLWKSERAGSAPTTIWSQPLGADGRSLVGHASRLLESDQAWEGNGIEAPSLARTDAGLLLFYSGNDWSSRGYAIGFARCASPTGPCTKPFRQPVLASHDQVAGPGGAECFTTADGQLWIAYHAYREPDVGYPASRLLRLARVGMRDGRPVFSDPF